MINRRHLRTSVMQALYSLQIDSNASLDVAMATFEDELKDMAFAQNQTNDWTAERWAEAQAAFELLRQIPVEDRKATFFPDETKVLATKVLIEGTNAGRQDRVLRHKQLLSNLESAYNFYLRILLLVPKLAEEVQKEEDERQARRIKPEPATETQMRLARNPYPPRIGATTALQQLATRRGLSWDDQDEFLRRLYRDGLKTNPYYEEYLAKEDHTEADDLRLTRWLLRVFLVNSPIVQELFEDENYAYGEIKAASLHLLQETIKAWQLVDSQGQVPIQDQGEDWEEAKEFLSTLFTKTLEHRPMVMNRLTEVVKNWDLSRVALIDLLLIQMSLAEMIEFPSIPIKVSINEYLEIAKQYSTPQSQAFLNGVLDKVSGLFVDERIIRKSGRGLMDIKTS
jgi:N utilization substance protein B